MVGDRIRLSSDWVQLNSQERPHQQSTHPQH